MKPPRPLPWTADESGMIYDAKGNYLFQLDACLDDTAAIAAYIVREINRRSPSSQEGAAKPYPCGHHHKVGEPCYGEGAVEKLIVAAKEAEVVLAGLLKHASPEAVRVHSRFWDALAALSQSPAEKPKGAL